MMIPWSEIGNALKLIFEESRKNTAWKNMFIDAGELIMHMEHDRGELYEQLSILFSKEQLVAVANDSKGQWGNDILSNIKMHLKNYFSDRELFDDEREKYINIYVEEIESQLKKEYPEMYDRIFIHELYENTMKGHNQTHEWLGKLADKFDETKTNPISILSLQELENRYIADTKRGCSLRLFNFENKKFVSRFINELESKTIRIKGENISEITAYIAYLFHYDVRLEQLKSQVLIVRDEEGWEWIQKQDIHNKILVASFRSEKGIQPIKNNKCIFLYGKKEYMRDHNYMELEKRLMSNLRIKLNECGYEHNESFELAQRSKNNYTVLMRNMTNGKECLPYWARASNNVLLAALVANQWVDSDGDRAIIELLVDDDYDSFMQELLQYGDPIDPFYIDYVTFGHRRKYVITEPEAAWTFFENYITEDLIDKVIDLMDYIIGEVDPKFDLPVEKHYMASIYNKKSNFSDTLKRGFTYSLIYLAMMDNWISVRVKTKLKEIFDQIDTNKKWFGISENLSDLVEISPGLVLDAIEKDIMKVDSGILNLFKEKGDSFFGGRAYYTHVIWTLEKALFIKGCSFQSIKVLTKLLDCDVKYNMINSPLDTLHKALVAWSHDYIYSIDEKVYYVRYVVENSKYGWKLLELLLPSNRSGAISGLSKPDFIEFEILDELKLRKQVRDTYMKYYRIALDNINGNIENLSVIYRDTIFFQFDLFDEIKSITFQVLSSASDQEKYLLYKRIYRQISKHRHFQDSNWAEKEEYLLKLEKEILVKIVFEDASFKYQLPFDSYDDILLNPIKHDDINTGDIIEKNDKGRELLRDNAIKELVQLKVDWCAFILRLEEDAPNVIGAYLAREKNDTDFIEKISSYLIETKKSILSVYYNVLFQKEGIGIIKRFLESEVLSKACYLRVLFERIRINRDLLLYLKGLSEELRRLFWETSDTPYFVNEQIKDLVYDEYYKYGNTYSLIMLINEYDFSVERNMSALEMLQKKYSESKNVSSYHIEQVLSKIYADGFPNDDIADRVIRIEIAFLKLLDEDRYMKYVKYYFSKDPKIAADLIRHAYKSSLEPVDKILNEEETLRAEVSHSILHRVKFSPTNNIKGEIVYEELRDWCKQYLEIVHNNGQERIGMQFLGGFLANSSKSESGEFPQEAVKKVIEEVYSEDLSKGFRIEISNSIGVRKISDGSDYYALNVEYENYVEKSQNYPKTQRILSEISKAFLREAKAERETMSYEF